MKGDGEASPGAKRGDSEGGGSTGDRRCGVVGHGGKSASPRWGRTGEGSERGGRGRWGVV